MSTTAAAVPEVGAVYAHEYGPHRVRVIEVGTGDRAGQVLVEYRTPGRFIGSRWWWAAEDVAALHRVPRGWDHV